MLAYVIRDFAGKEVHRVDVTGKSERDIEKVGNGLFLRMDHERFTADLEED